VAVDLGDLYRLSFTLNDPDGTPVSADVMTLTITLPDQTVTTVTPVDPISPGVYQYDYLTVQSGLHVARWVGTGTNPGADASVFDVASTDPPYLISLAAAKKQLNITDASADDELRLYVESATYVVEDLTGEVAVRRTITETNEIAAGTLVLKRSPVVSLTSLASIDGLRTWDVSQLHPSQAGVVHIRPWLGRWERHVTATYVAGPAVIAANVQLAASIIIEHLWQTKRGSRGAALPGGLEDTMMPRGLGFAVPNRAIELLGLGMPGVF
jgi:hypothetical protein